MKSSWVIGPCTLLAVVCWWGVFLEAGRTQSMIPAVDGTGTQVTHDGDRFDIQGGSRSGDGSNLFHSFDHFGLEAGQTANFLANPDIQNIFTRVVGGNPSVIQGLLQVSGSHSNLYLINPAGILFGPTAQLNLTGSFLATTANSLGFNSGASFEVLGPSSYHSLTGSPNQFDFTQSQGGSIVNAGDLAVGFGENITLMGGTVLNTGTLTAPGGNITIASVPGPHRVRLSQEGMLLSLEFQAIAPSAETGISPLQLPQLLTNGNLTQGHARGAVVNPDGTITLTGSNLSWSPDAGTTMVSGEISVADGVQTGGTVTILGEKIGAIGSTIDASGGNGGGEVYLGGDFQGGSRLPNADRTLISPNSTIRVDALSSGNGGRAIVWSDRLTGFYGNISARGGSNPFSPSQNGGFVEVSGKEHLIFEGIVDVSATHGSSGTLLLDPLNIIISNGEDDPANIADFLPNILSGEGDEFAEATLTISAETLQNQIGNIILEATNNIEIANNVSLQFVPGESIVFRADADNEGTGAFLMNPSSQILAQGRDINIFGANITVTTIDTSAEGDGGNISLTSSNGNIEARQLISQSTGSGTGGDITLSAGGTGAITIQPGNLDASSASEDGGTITLTTATGDITTGDIISKSEGSGTAGDITLRAGGTGAINVGQGNGILDASSASGDGGTIILTTATGNITTRTILANSEGSGTGGEITLNAEGDGDIIIQTGNASIDASSASGDGGVIDLNTEGGDITTQDLSTNSNATPGNITLDASTGTLRLRGNINTNNLNVRADAIEATGNSSATGRGRLVIEPGSAGRNVAIAPTDNNLPTDTLILGDNLLSALTNGFNSIVIGRPDSSGNITLHNNFDFTAPVTIAGGETLTGPNQNTTWTLTGPGRGTLSGYPNGMRFENIENLTGGSASDTFEFPDGARFGRIDGAAGSDLLDYSNYTGEVTVDLPRNIATGTSGAFNIENVTLPDEEPEPTPAPEDGGNFYTPVIKPAPKIDPLPLPPWAQSTPEPQTGEASDPTSPEPDISEPIPVAEPVPIPVAEPAPIPVAEPAPIPVAEPAPIPVAEPAPIPVAEPAPSPVAEPAPIPVAEPAPIPVAEPAPIPVAEPAPIPVAEPAPIPVAGPAPIPVAGPDTQGGGGLPEPAIGIPVPAEPAPIDVPSVTETGHPWTPSPGDRFMGSTGLEQSNQRTDSDILSQPPILQLNNRSDIDRLLDSGQIELAIEMGDRVFSEDFEEYLGQNINLPYLSFETIQNKLREMETLTGKNAGLIYVFSRNEQLDLVLIPPVGKPIYKSVPEANQAVLFQEVQHLQEEIGNVARRRTTSYLAPAQQLYQWIIAPLEPDLKRLGIDTTIFSMDAGLRMLPIAALHDGEQFLVEKYNLTLIPSLHLTDARYSNWKSSEVLAMGLSEFSDQSPLPAVPVEIDTIVNHLWPGAAFLNEAVTLDKLQELRGQEPFGIIHLATHGQFNSGARDNSYLQLWGEKLRLDRMQQLQWNDPPVELLVLSACRTAIGDLEAEFGFAGLAVQAGVKSAVASLWYANDAGTLGLMSEFYQNLRSAPIKAEALRRAQIAMIGGTVHLENGALVGSFGNVELPPELSRLGNRDLRHPYYWAGFTMIGSPW
ncbi:CHAT domain-containing protein [Laspinema olomoucense]|uniref:CHAT domain-containing protein n=1 Tax=Laspinema olomoucense TaxID=3231600 RepID=UPI0021BA5BD8|nr:CHAT domain-containing protein [Laspinema sp. D3d]MCT7973276.1 CHAT domain-containing protein [Laspinema sp. D3d]